MSAFPYFRTPGITAKWLREAAIDAANAREVGDLGIDPAGLLAAADRIVALEAVAAFLQEEEWSSRDPSVATIPHCIECDGVEPTLYDETYKRYTEAVEHPKPGEAPMNQALQHWARLPRGHKQKCRRGAALKATEAS